MRLTVRAVVRGAVAALSLALAASLAGCGSQQHAPSASQSSQGVSSTSQAVLSSSGTRRVTKLLVFVVENHSLAQMQDQMPWTYGLAKQYAYATDYHAIRHPSLPNYLAIAGGSTFGVADDQGPSAHRIRARSVFGQALRAHRSAKLYADGMPGRCVRTDGGEHYAVRHNPWAYFVREHRACRRHDVPVTRLARDAAAGRLPNAGMVIPNTIHDAHDASLADADAWLRQEIEMVQRGPDWRRGRLAIVVTADEDDRHSDNRVLTVVATPAVEGRGAVGRRLTHYSLTRLYDDVLGARHLRHARTAPSMTRAFRIPVRRR